MTGVRAGMAEVEVAGVMGTGIGRLHVGAVVGTARYPWQARV